MMALLSLFLVFLRCLDCIKASLSPHITDKIIQLPGQPIVEFHHFSGYVNVDEKKEKTLFYYFVEAEIDPPSKPVVLWLNGGPGCSSIGVGAFSENGPFRPSAKVLLRNEYSWNREANMLYLDTPVGVGFSYSTASYEKTVTDEITAEDNLVFLQRWLLKFPQYRNSSLFITGESYAGHYVPQLAKLIIQLDKKKKTIKLKGIALGNPLLEFSTDYNSRAEYMWSHGLISDTTYDRFSSVCNYSRYVSEYYRDSLSVACSRIMSQVNRESSRFVSKYDVTLDVCIPSVLAQSKLIAPQQNAERIDVCVEDETINYLNRQDVQRAMHAKLVGVSRWDVCSSILDYDMLDLEKPTIPIIGSLVKQGISVLIYRSLVCRLANQLGLETTVPHRVWFEGQQVGGWTQVYGNILSFATIRGASHEAPFSQPQRSFVLFKSFLGGRPLPLEF
ncbi:Serine carboxypeptidase-like 45 [Orobanche hederae]